MRALRHRDRNTSRFRPDQLADKTAIVGSGNAVRLLKCIQWAAWQEFGLPLQLAETKEEAAVGAAQLALTAK
ncbi:MAG: hypothetical protein PHI35_09125 [Victivallaceae bacterium]|nr:hypothetical protein [Victivallaceae bacterium]